MDEAFPHIQFPGDDTKALFNRTSKHEGPGHELSTVYRGAQAKPFRATLACTCGAVIVIIADPTPKDMERIGVFGPIRRG